MLRVAGLVASIGTAVVAAVGLAIAAGGLLYKIYAVSSVFHVAYDAATYIFANPITSALLAFVVALFVLAYLQHDPKGIIRFLKKNSVAIGGSLVIAAIITAASTDYGSRPRQPDRVDPLSPEFTPAAPVPVPAPLPITTPLDSVSVPHPRPRPNIAQTPRQAPAQEVSSRSQKTVGEPMAILPSIPNLGLSTPAEKVIGSAYRQPLAYSMQFHPCMLDLQVNMTNWPKAWEDCMSRNLGIVATMGKQP